MPFSEYTVNIHRLLKVHKQQGWPQAWEYSQAKPIQTLGRASQGVNWSWSQRQKHLIWAVEENNWTVTQCSKVLFSDESKCWISFGNQGPRVWRKIGEAQNPCCLKSSVKFPQSVMIWAAMSSAGVGPLCFLMSTVKRSHLPGNFRVLHASFCWQALWRCWFHFPVGLGTCPHCQRYQKLIQWPWCYCAWLVSKLAWPEPHWESRWETPDPTMQMSWRPLSKKPGLPYHLSSATNWSPPCHAELRQ